MRRRLACCLLLLLLLSAAAAACAQIVCFFCGVSRIVAGGSYAPCRVILVITNSPVEGGLEYNVVYWPTQRLPTSFPGGDNDPLVGGISKKVRPEELRARFTKKDTAEYYDDKLERWLQCTVRAAAARDVAAALQELRRALLLVPPPPPPLLLLLLLLLLH